MTKPGPSSSYRDLLRGKITPDEYVKRIKREVDERLKERPPAREKRAAAG